MTRKTIATTSAPAAIGTYSQAVNANGVVYMSGQIPLVPDTMELVGDDFEAQATQVFENLRAVANAAGGDLSDIVKLTVYLTDLSNFATVNEVMARHFSEPFPRAPLSKSLPCLKVRKSRSMAFCTRLTEIAVILGTCDGIKRTAKRGSPVNGSGHFA